MVAIVEVGRHWGGDQGVNSFQIIKQARTRGLEDWNDSHLVRERFVGRGEEGSEIEEESHIKKRIAPQPEEIFDIRTRQVDMGGFDALSRRRWQAKR